MFMVTACTSPQTLSGITVCVVYNPSNRSAQEQRNLDEYLVYSTDYFRNKYPDCGLVTLGDFNNFDISSLTSGHNLKQVVYLPTRGAAILDLIVNYLCNLEGPRILAPLGSADHSIVQWLPCGDETRNLPNNSKSIKRFVRRYPRSEVDAFGRWACTHDRFS